MINTPLTATEPNGARTSAVASADAPYPAYLTVHWLARTAPKEALCGTDQRIINYCSILY